MIICTDVVWVIRQLSKIEFSSLFDFFHRLSGVPVFRGKCHPFAPPKSNTKNKEIVHPKLRNNPENIRAKFQGLAP